MLGKLEIQLASSDEKCNFFQLTFFRPNFKTSSKKTFAAPHPTSIYGIMYANLVREKAAPAILNLYPGGDGIYQDDGARIHHCPEALAAVEECFSQRINQDLQAPKMADFWPIENTWAILKQKIAKINICNLAQLQREISKAWREIDADKQLCRRMMTSMHRRASAFIQKEGNQIFKNDYE